MKNAFVYTLSGDQLAAAMRFRNRQLTRYMRGRHLIQAIGYLAWLAMLIALFAAHESNGSSLMRISLYLMAGAYGAYLLLYNRALERAYRTDHDFVNGPIRLELHDDGLSFETKSFRTMVRWPGVKTLDQAGDMLLLGLDGPRFLPLPLTSFESQEEKNEFLSFVNTKRAANLADVAGENADSPAAVEAERHWNAFKKNLVNAFQLAVGRSVAPATLTISYWQALAFAILGLLPPLVFDFATTGAHGEIAWENMPSALFHVPIFWIAAGLAAYALGRVDGPMWIFQVLLMIAAVIDLAFYSLYSLPLPALAREWLHASSQYVYLCWFLWLLLAVGKVLVDDTSLSRNRRIWSHVVLALIIFYPLAAVDRERSLWRAPVNSQETEQSEEFGRLSEETLYNQRENLEREISAIMPGRAGVIDVFFIGVAGYGPEDVFMREVNAVSALFQQRFDARGRTIRLINNHRQPGDAPIASITSLRAALNRTAAVMDKDEDLLFLFLTSHGSRDYQFSLDLWPIKFQELDPIRLRQLLDDSGIKNRVIVVSACYSGGFIDALKSENTLVITAAAPDKNSFGCGNEAEWTYFGKAYFDEALRHTYSFIEAFERAKPVIAERERQEGFTASEPQIAVGAAIESKVKRFETELNLQGP